MNKRIKVSFGTQHVSECFTAACMKCCMCCGVSVDRLAETFTAELITLCYHLIDTICNETKQKCQFAAAVFTDSSC